MHMRNFICNVLLSIAIPEASLCVFSNFSCSDVSDYLKKEQMWQNGTYGGDLEITAFCTVFEVEVVVYVSQAKTWLVYKPFNRTSVDFPALFLSHNNNHWQAIVLFVNSDTSQSISTDTLRKRSYAATKKPLNFLNAQSKGKSHDVPESRHCGKRRLLQTRDQNFVTSTKFLAEKRANCTLCERTSTKWYPFEMAAVACDTKKGLTPRKL